MVILNSPMPVMVLSTLCAIFLGVVDCVVIKQSWGMPIHVPLREWRGVQPLLAHPWVRPRCEGE